MNKKVDQKITTTEVAKVEAGYVDTANIGVESQLVNEIKMITAQTKQMVLFSTIEIGRRLVEAKKLVKHGQWGKWLEERVNFTQRTANNFMKIYQEYGESGLAQQSESIANLSYTHALALLNVPSEERKRFAEETNAKDMTIKELKATIADLTSQKSEVERQLEDQQKRCEALIDDKDKAKADAEARAKALNDQISALEQQAKEAEANKEKDVQTKLESAIEAERKRLEEVEGEKAKLQGEIETLRKQQSEAMEQAKAEERRKVEVEIEKRDKELADLKAKMQAQAKQAVIDLDCVKAQVAEERAKNERTGDVARCWCLIEEVLDSYAKTIDAIIGCRGFDKKTGDSMFADLENGLAILRKKANIKVKVS